MSYYGSLSVGELKAYGQQVAAKYQVPWPIFDAMIQIESGWSTSSSEVSSAGAQGIAQIMPGTAADWHVNPWDPYAALDAAAQHLSEYYTQFGNSWPTALAAYNGGASPQGIANSNREGYASKVLAAAKTLGGDVGSALQSGANTATTSSAVTSSADPTGSTPSSFLQSIHDLPFGVGPGVESLASAGIVLTLSLALLGIGGLWLIMGNAGSRSLVVATGKTAAKAATIAA